MHIFTSVKRAVTGQNEVTDEVSFLEDNSLICKRKGLNELTYLIARFRNNEKVECKYFRSCTLNIYCRYNTGSFSNNKFLLHEGQFGILRNRNIQLAILAVPIECKVATLCISIFCI